MEHHGIIKESPFQECNIDHDQTVCICPFTQIENGEFKMRTRSLYFYTSQENLYFIIISKIRPSNLILKFEVMAMSVSLFQS